MRNSLVLQVLFLYDDERVILLGCCTGGVQGGLCLIHVFEKKISTPKIRDRCFFSRRTGNIVSWCIISNRIREKSNLNIANIFITFLYYRRNKYILKFFPLFNNSYTYQQHKRVTLKFRNLYNDYTTQMRDKIKCTRRFYHFFVIR